MEIAKLKTVQNDEYCSFLLSISCIICNYLYKCSLLSKIYNQYEIYTMQFSKERVGVFEVVFTCPSTKIILYRHHTSGLSFPKWQLFYYIQ